MKFMFICTKIEIILVSLQFIYTSAFVVYINSVS